MKTIALLALLAVGCGGEAFTSTGQPTDRLPGPAVDSATMTDAGVTPGNDSPADPPEADGGVTLPDAPAEQYADAAPDVTPATDAPVTEEDAAPDAPDAESAVCPDMCPVKCIPVYQVACCKADSTCGCMNAQMGVWPCN